MDMEFTNHYSVLGLPSGGDQGGSRLSDKDITKAYKAKALVLHPDKRRNDPAAHSEFQKLKESYQILKDVKARELFDSLLLSRLRRHSVLNSNQQQSKNTDAKRRRMMADLEERERRCYSGHHRDNDEFVRREEENRIAEKLKQEVAKIRAMMATASNKAAAAAAEAKPLDRARVLKVSWEINSNPNPNAASCGYTADRLRQLCGRFGEVEDVLVSKKRNKCCSALVVMADKDSAVAASWSVLGDVSNPLMVQPLDSTPPPPPPPAAVIDPANHSKFEELVLAKLKQAVDRRKELI